MELSEKTSSNGSSRRDIPTLHKVLGLDSLQVRAFMQRVHAAAQFDWTEIPLLSEPELDAWYEDGWPKIRQILGADPTLLLLSWEDVPLLRLVRRNETQWGRSSVFTLCDDRPSLFTTGVVGEIQGTLIVATPYTNKHQLVTSAPCLEEVLPQNALWIDAG